MDDESALPTVLRKKLPPTLEKIKNGHYTEDDLDYPIHIYLKENDIRVDETGSDIINFLRGKTILVTGATGFLGKLLVEKLLRCCKDIDTIYVILRTKKGKDPQDRAKEFLNNWVFVKLSHIYPNFREKVKGLDGDLEQDGLGLSEKSRNILKARVNIIYHVAATVRLNEKLKKAIKINIQGTQEVIKLAKECKNFNVLTYFGTAYSNSVLKEIKEEIYQPAMNPQALIEVANNFPSDLVDKMTPGLLGKYPNTYVLTKHIAEEVVRQEAIGLPTCIVRPSMVIGAVREPVRFWLDNYYGPIGVTTGASIGLINIFLANRDCRCDMVPADYVINNCIAASYKTFKDRLTDEVQVFNCTMSNDNPLTYKSYTRYTKKSFFLVPSTKTIKGFFFRTTDNWYVFSVLWFILHTIPGYIFDFVASRVGKEARLMKAYVKIYEFVMVAGHFMTNEWTFETKNNQKLWNSLNEIDKAIFPFDMRTLNWAEYFVCSWTSMREFIMFEFLDNLEAGRSHLRRVTIIQQTVISTTLALTIYFLINTKFCFIPICLICLILYFKNLFK